MNALVMPASETAKSNADGTGEADKQYTDAKSTLLLPFSVYSSSIGGGYRTKYSDQFKIDFNNLTYLDKLNLYIPNELEGVDSSLLNPQSSWSSAEEYEKECDELCLRFKENFKQFNVSQEIVDAGPK